MNNTNNLIVMSVNAIDRRQSPVVYTASKINDTLEAVEEFFEDASIEVHYEVVERIAKELDDNGYAYFRWMLFNLV